MRQLRLGLLGGFQARLDSGPPLTFRTHKAQALLAYLGLPAGAAHGRDQLPALPWGEIRDEQARSSLRQALYDLRRALGACAPALLHTDGETVALDPAAVDVDVATFTRLVGEGTPHALEQAASLYQGDLLAGSTVKEDPWEAWLMEERERLRELAVQGLTRLLTHQRTSGAAEAALRTAQQLLALDRLQESVHRTLMQLYAELGRRGAALRQYQHCVSVMQRELGLEPEAQTKQLYQDIVRQRASASGAGAAGPAPSPDGRQLFRAGPATRPVETPLVGREAEMAQLHVALDEASAGRGRLLAILGEAGIGKSRMVEELIALAARRDCRVLVGRAYESDQILFFGPWVDAFSAGELAQDREVLDALGPVWRSELARLLPEVTAPGAPALPGQANHRRLFESVARLLKQLTAPDPLLVVLEDLHWADEASLHLLAFLGRRVQTERMLVAVTAREEELEDARVLRDTLEDLARAEELVPLRLSSLTQPDTVALVRMLVPASAAATVEELGAQVWIASEGNPFVVVETMRALQEGAATPGMALPERVREVIERRLGRLADRSRSLLAVAAAIGREFDFDLLRCASGLDEDATAEGVEELVRRRVLTVVGERLAFTHERIREVAYSGLLRWRRRRLHYKIAEALEGLHADNLEPHYEALGLHYQQAEAWPKATLYLHQAANKAVSRSAYQRAIRCFEHALAALEHLPPERAALEDAIAIRLDLAPVLAATRSFAAPEVGDVYLKALALCEKVGETPKLFRTLCGLARFHGARGALRTARDLGEHLIALARRGQDPALMMEAYHTQSAILFSLGALAAAWDHAEQGIALYDPQQHSGHAFLYGGHDPGVCFMTHAAWALWMMGYPDQALQRVEDALSLARELAHPYTLAHALYYAAVLHMQRGEGPTVQARTEEVLALATEHDAPRWLVLATALRGRLLVEQGALEEGIALMRLGAAAHEWRDHLYYGVLLADACGRAGKTDEGLSVVNGGLARVSSTGFRYYEAELYRIKGELLLTSPAEAESCFQQARDIARGQMATSLELRATMSLSRLWQRQGKPAGARAMLAETYDRFTEGFDTVDLEQAKALLDHLAGPSGSDASC